MSAPIGITDRGWLRVYRREAWLRQGKRCFWCLRFIPLEGAAAEHLKPKSRGGLNGSENIACACRGCNRTRGSIPVNLFKRMLNGGLPCPNFDVRLIAMTRRIEKRIDLACKRIKAVAA